MPSLYADIDINAPRQRVWQILVEKERWKYWNTFLYDCNPNQPFAEGQEVSLSLLRIPGEEEIQFRPFVMLVQSNTCLKWVSSIPGFRNEHIFQLQDIDENRTQLIYQQNFSGPLTKVFLPFIRQDEQKGMRRMVSELKQYAEKNGRRNVSFRFKR